MKRWASGDSALLGMLACVMLVLGYVEHLLPLSSAMPGMKLGLANTVLLYALYTLSVRKTLLLMVVKVLLSGFLFGGVNAIMYSFAGGMLSLIAMICLRRVPGMGIIGVSVGGAVFHNVGQVLLAMLMLKTNKLFYYLWLLLLAAIGTGMLTGIVANVVLRSLDRAGFKQ